MAVEFETSDARAASSRVSEVAILIPCYNEERTVAEVVTSFREQLPRATIYVFDNNSIDRTAEKAREAGAIVFREPRRGKGFVVQSMFRRVEAEVYVMVDGDATYAPEAVHDLIAPIVAGDADMVVGSRLHPDTKSEFKQLNRWGNRLVLAILNSIFRVQLTDILSGYRAFNRRFVKSLPVFGGGFEIETELTIKSVARGLRVIEVPTALTARPEGSHSKIRLFRDGFLIVNTILALFRDYKPLTFFGVPGLLLLLIGVASGLIVALNVFASLAGQRLLLAVASIAVSLCGLLLLAVGLVLHSIARRSQEFEYQAQVIIDEIRNLVHERTDR